MTLQELAELVEGAEGASRELDRLIVTTLCPGATVSEYIRGEGDDIVFHAEALGIRNKDCCPWYTHSLDAAMSLVPRGWRFLLDKRPGAEDRSDASYRASVWLAPTVLYDQASCWAHSPALALCAASLKALSKREGEDG